ncbi:hypothetical protein [Microvirga massiliensis]|uniref:hypothetical protein n=1 Tax=Microvirga massiliensis TaxID=1033741 RepID=UPI00062B3125|nr:hypothetical protein [Microvirga massiliensis]
MAAYAKDKPVFLSKKLGGLLLICGSLLAALAYSDGTTGLNVPGILLAGGVILLVLRIVRRNQDISSDQ